MHTIDQADQRLAARMPPQVVDDHASRGLRLRFDEARDPIVVIRPDRFVAALASPARLEGVMARLAAQLAQG